MLPATPEKNWRWYEHLAKNRILTPDFISSIRWDLINPLKVEPRILRILCYFRDVELLTHDAYGPEQQRVYQRYTGTSPESFSDCISSFLTVWITEETTHGNVHEMILERCGLPGYKKPEIKLPPRKQALLYKLMGELYMAIHMTWGAVNEMSTQAGYIRLAELTENPELQRIFRAISREEGRHLAFYFNMARLLLRKSLLARILVRRVMNTKWRPVGGGEIPLKDALPALELFAGNELWRFEESVGKRVRTLPGLNNLNLTPIVERTYQEALAA